MFDDKETRQGFGEEIGGQLAGWAVVDGDGFELDLIANPEFLHSDVLHFGLVNGVNEDLDGGLVVDVERGRGWEGVTNFS